MFQFRSDRFRDQIESRYRPNLRIYQTILIVGSAIYIAWHYLAIWMYPADKPDLLWPRILLASLSVFAVIAEHRKWITLRAFLAIYAIFQFGVLINDCRLSLDNDWAFHVQSGYTLTLMCIAVIAFSFRMFLWVAAFGFALPFVLNSSFFHLPWVAFKPSTAFSFTVLSLLGVLIGYQFKIRNALFEQNNALRLYHLSLENSFDFCIWVDSEGEIVLSNRAFRQAFHLSEGASFPVSKILADFKDLDWKKSWAELKARKALTFETRLVLPDGRQIPVHVTANWISINDLEYNCAIIRDLTQQRELEGRMQEQQVQLMNASKLTAIGEMAGGIAHEINNPLAIIAGKTTMIRMLQSRGKLDAEKLASELSVIDRTVDRVVHIIRSMRSLIRNAEGDPMQSTGVGELIDDTLQLCQENFRVSGIRLDVNVEAELPPILCRPSQISQILLNLLNNAHDAITHLSDRWIRLSARALEHHLEISVEDSGKGIPGPIAEKIMQPFFTTKPPGKGTGLGLSIARKIAEDHGGSLTLDRKSKHTRFVLLIPRKVIDFPRRVS